MKTIVMLPTYNEIENIVPIIQQILSQANNIEIVVVDDNSPDGTGNEVEKIKEKNSRVHLITRTDKKGRGFAGIEGFLYAINKNFDLIIEMDADFSHNPKYISQIIKKLEDSEIVICSRLVKGGGEMGRSIFRRIVTLLSNFFIRHILNLKTKDCTSGFRGFRKYVLESIPLKELFSEGPSILEETLYLCSQKNYSIQEIPYIFENRYKGQSKLGINTLIKTFITIIKIRQIYKTKDLRSRFF